MSLDARAYSRSHVLEVARLRPGGNRAQLLDAQLLRNGTKSVCRHGWLSDNLRSSMALL